MEGGLESGVWKLMWFGGYQRHQDLSMSSRIWRLKFLQLAQVTGSLDNVKILHLRFQKGPSFDQTSGKLQLIILSTYSLNSQLRSNGGRMNVEHTLRRDKDVFQDSDD